MMNQAPLEPIYAIEQYESLRREAIGACLNSRRGHGLALLLNRGMAEWFKALSVFSKTPTTCFDPSQFLEGSGPPRLEQSSRSPLTLVLANMVITCCQELRQ